MLLHEQLDAVIRVLAGFSREAVAAVVLLLAIYVAWRWWERRTAQKLEVQPNAVDELQALVARDSAPLIVEVRGASMRRVDPGPDPTGIAIHLQVIAEGHTDTPRAIP